VPWQNRVTPFGKIVATPARGTLMGNRGVLHDRERRLVRDSQTRRWIACELQFRGRHRAVMSPGTYTELFFLDEATALAAGHRPCAECRHTDYRVFQEAWRTARPDVRASADAIDAVLHAERRMGPWRKRTYVADIRLLPDGACIALGERAWLVKGNVLHGWSEEGYAGRRERPTTLEVTVLTPPSLVAVLDAGYLPRLHASVEV
jgi:hypothetical protein